MNVSQLQSGAGSGPTAAAAVATSLVTKKNAPRTPVQTLGPLVANESSSVTAKSSSPTTSGASQQITSSDFLTLLVSELKNQDPTQPTDPNAYISQLVGVNSLQQLIQINQGLTSLETPPASSSPSIIQDRPVTN